MARGPDDRGSEIPPEKVPVTVRLRPNDIRGIIDIPDGSQVMILYESDRNGQERADMTLEGDEYVFHNDVSPGLFEYFFIIYFPQGGQAYYPEDGNFDANISAEAPGTQTGRGVTFSVETPLNDKDNRDGYEDDDGEDRDRRGPSRRERIFNTVDYIAGATVGRVIDATAKFARKRRDRKQARAQAQLEDAQDRNADILPDRFPVNFRIKQSDFVKFPQDPEVVLRIFNDKNPDGINYPMRKEGDGFVSDIELPPGRFKYIFEIKSSTSQIINPMYHPSRPEEVELLGDGSVNAQYLPAGIAITQGVQWSQGEHPHAFVDESEISETRGQTVTSLQETFGELFRKTAPLVSQKPGEVPKRNALKEFHQGLQHAADRMVDIATSRRQDVRSLLQGDLFGIVNEAQNQWVAGRTDLSGQARNELQTANGRLRFRIKTFNELCNQKKLGLKPRHKIQAAMHENAFMEYASKKLGRHSRVFDRICSSYDGGNVRRALYGAVDATAEEAPKINDFDTRGKARSKLFGKITGRLRKDTIDIYTLDMKRWGKWAKALEEVGDISLKAGAVTLLAMSGIGYFTVPAAGILWSLRGISESLGYDFGSVLAKGITYPYRLASAGVRKAGKLPPAPVAIPRASLSAWERLKLLARGVWIVPPALTYLPKVGEKIEEWVPGSDLSPGETAMDEREHSAGDVETACKRILGEGGGHPPSPVPPAPAPGHGPTPATPTPGGHPTPEHPPEHH